MRFQHLGVCKYYIITMECHRIYHEALRLLGVPLKKKKKPLP